ncbi:MAG: hypothetical protein HYY16_00100 [Planctomycetes bacterium]|nr:hypothetical protein [Planctomycetota bacterium]
MINRLRHASTVLALTAALVAGAGARMINPSRTIAPLTPSTVYDGD